MKPTGIHLAYISHVDEFFRLGHHASGKNDAEFKTDICKRISLRLEVVLLYFSVNGGGF